MPRRNKKTNKMPYLRRHTNKNSLRGIKNGKYKREIKKLAKELGIPFREYPFKKIDYSIYFDKDIGDRKIAEIFGWIYP